MFKSVLRGRDLLSSQLGASLAKTLEETTQEYNKAPSSAVPENT
jgi:hypothetical protein